MSHEGSRTLIRDLHFRKCAGNREGEATTSEDRRGISLGRRRDRRRRGDRRAGGRAARCAAERRAVAARRRWEVTETESGRAPTAAENEAADFVKVILAQHRGRLGRAVLAADRPSLRAAQAGAVHRRRGVGLRASPARGRAVLLPARFAGVPGSALLRASSTGGSAPPATSRRPTWSPTRWATTCRTCSGSPNACTPQRIAHVARPPATACRSRPSSRPTAWPASGRSTPTARGQLLEPGDAEEGLTRGRARSATTRLQKAARGRVGPRVVHARLVRASACAGSRPGCRRGRVAGLRHLRSRRPDDPSALTFPRATLIFAPHLRGLRMVGAPRVTTRTPAKARDEMQAPDSSPTRT